MLPPPNHRPSQVPDPDPKHQPGDEKAQDERQQHPIFEDGVGGKGEEAGEKAVSKASSIFRRTLGSNPLCSDGKSVANQTSLDRAGKRPSHTRVMVALPKAST